MDKNAPVIKAENLSKTYRLSNRNRVEALKNVSLTISKGEFVIVSGPSGSGKSTLLSLLGSLDRPSEGRLFYGGDDITGFSDEELCRIRRQRIGFVFQEFHLMPRMTAWENVSIGLLPLGVREKERFRRASDLLDQLGLHERTFHRPEELSGGEQQRVSVARALIHGPEIVLADEPTSNIDAASARNVIKALDERRAKGCTIILATHDADMFQKSYLQENASMTHPSYCLYNGRIVSETCLEGNAPGMK